ncbi:ribonuclease HII [Lactobacillus sp. YT155]|uniref:ribonuclease HII n=1 Tax=Lactobacillus sp. YT155 TaxID=3060955 RepID=UPI00265DACD5|nr:ribonuclease HII [Lactobacillus sp. YT155]MDO1605398.1 ribonuclease HII [Lactobacillus sp. YT155]
MQSIKEIQDILSTLDVSDDQLAQFQQDKRKGVQNALNKYRKKLLKQEELRQAFQERMKYEKPLWQQQQIVAGVDEVGRGPLAGPVVCAAVVLPNNNTLYEVNDSKQLSDKKRRKLFQDICEQALDISIGVGSAELIDKENIYHATELVMKQAVESLNLKPTYLLVDAMTVPVDIAQQKIIKGDANSVSIAAASIVAKEIRDDLMKTYDQVYPGYDFSHNVGYGTKNHLEGLREMGACPIHRKTFAPIKDIL